MELFDISIIVLLAPPLMKATSRHCSNLIYDCIRRSTAKQKLVSVYVDSVVEWLERRDCDQHGLDSKPTRTILLCPWERHFTAFSPTWWSWQAVPNFGDILIKFQADSNILLTPEVDLGNCLPYVFEPPSFSCQSEG